MVIDRVIFSIVFGIIMQMFFSSTLKELIIAASSDIQNIPEFLGAVLRFSILPILIMWLITAAFESSSIQGTPGKALLGIRITDLNGNRISFLRASARFYTKYIFSGILYIVAAFTEKKQAIHDILSGTLVVQSTVQIAHTNINSKRNIEADLIKELDSGRFNSYEELLQRKEELMKGKKK